MRDRIFVCSALRGDIKCNQNYAELYCKYACNAGKAPYAPHLLMTRFLDDDVAEERQAGIESGLAFLQTCKEIWVFVVNGTVSSGMRAEIDVAADSGITIKWFTYTPGLNFPPHELRHLEDRSDPSPSELMPPDVFVREASGLFSKMAKALQKGDCFAEDFEEELDDILGTGLTPRNREAEAIFETVVKNQETT